MTAPRRVGVAALSVGVAAAALLGLFAASGLRRGDSVDTLMPRPELVYTVNDADAVVVASDVELGEAAEREGVEYRFVSMTVDDVLYTAHTSLSELRVGEALRAQYGAEAESVPPTLTPDVRIRAHEVVTDHEITMPQLTADVDSGGSYVLLLQYVDRRLFPEHPTDWILMFAATPGPLGKVIVPHTNGPQWTSELQRLAKLRPDLATQDVSQVMSDWLQDVDGERSGVTAQPGTILASVRDAEQPPLNTDAAWYASSSDVRPLDPELTPDDVLADLRSVTVLIDIEGTITDRTYLVIRNEMGVSHVAELSAGSHPATLLAPEGAAWTIELTGEDGAAAVKVGEVASSEWGLSDYGVLTVSGTKAATASGKYRDVTVQQFSDAITRQADLATPQG